MQAGSTKLMDYQQLTSRSERWPGGLPEGGSSVSLPLKPQRFWQRQRRQKWARLPQLCRESATSRGKRPPRYHARFCPRPPASRCPASTVPPPAALPLPRAPGNEGASPGSHYLLRSHGERCGYSRCLGSARLAELSSLPHPAALRREPAAHPAPHKCINSSHIMINSSVRWPEEEARRAERGWEGWERAAPFAQSSPPLPEGSCLYPAALRSRPLGAPPALNGHSSRASARAQRRLRATSRVAGTAPLLEEIPPPRGGTAAVMDSVCPQPGRRPGCGGRPRHPRAAHCQVEAGSAITLRAEMPLNHRCRHFISSGLQAAEMPRRGEDNRPASC